MKKSTLTLNMIQENSKTLNPHQCYLVQMKKLNKFKRDQDKHAQEDRLNSKANKRKKEKTKKIEQINK